MEFLPEDIAAYIQAHTAAEPELLKKIARDTHAQVLKPRMLSGNVQGRFLSLISKLMQPRVVLEIGTYTGYSAICLAEGLALGGKLITMDVNEELENRVRGYFEQAGLKEVIDFRIGNALNLLPSINETYDLVFIDADKENYLNYYSLVINKVRSGGLILADNVLWSGKITQLKTDKDTRALQEFNDVVVADTRVECMLLPLRDGIMMARKK